jgi:phenylacetate-coenzyme A ligase PaaK-like adenylate-forming protein
VSSWLERAGNLMSGLRRRRADDARTRWSRDQLEAYQRARLSELVRHASERSPFYRALYGGRITGDVELASLPTVDKHAMMESFDRFVTDPRLRLADLEAFVARVRDDDLYLGEYRVMASSGSSGRKGVYVYDREAWRSGLVPAGLRMAAMAGVRPRLPRPRILHIAAPDAKHMTFRGARSIEVGLFAVRRIAATAPLAELCAGATAHRPDQLYGYPSVLALMAEEQRAGRLRLAPTSVITTSEMRSPAMTEAIRDAWGVEPFDCLGLTETGIAAVDCALHRGLHIFEDFVIIEAAADGMYVTNLTNRAQPIIRFHVSDLVRIDDTPCPCGSTFRRIVALDGRSDDVLVLPGARGAVRVHPIHVRGPLAAARGVVQYQVTDRDDGLDVQVVLAADAASDTAATVTRRIEHALREQGADVAVRVRAVAAIPRELGAGKLKQVRSERSQ